ncbi:type II secretion system protein [bacterium]|nr:type II secretion system protein [bacterium]
MTGNINNKTLVNNGFTLAEVLITLAIIGVVAAITMPIIMTNAKNHEYVNRLKKAYSVLKQSSYRISMASGYPVGDFSFMENDDFFENFASEVAYSKICRNDHEGCFTPNKVKSLRGAGWEYYDTKNSLVSNDGISYGWYKEIWCTGKGFVPSDERNCIGRFIVDVNGQNPPNKFGRDVYFFGVINNKGIVPAGEYRADDCKKDGNGITCAGRVLKEGKISY